VTIQHNSNTTLQGLLIKRGSFYFHTSLRKTVSLVSYTHAFEIVENNNNGGYQRDTGRDNF